MHTKFSVLPALIVVGLFAFVGCTDSFVAYDQAEPARTAYDGPKFRHAHLLERAVRIQSVGKGASSSTIGLIIKANGRVSRYGIVSRYGLVSRYEYNEVFYGLAAEVEQSQLDSVLAEMENDPDIIWVEPDFSVIMPPSNATDFGSSQQIPWSVAAVGGQTSWAVSGDGQGHVNVDVYILDTGVANADNNDPNDDLALVESIDFRGDFDDAKDYYGHGTHLAGIIGAVDDSEGLVGLAPGARVHNLKVLGDEGTSDVSVVIAAIEHVTAQKLANPSTPIVVNLSIGEDISTPAYSALDEAVDASAATGVVYVIAAGNEGRNVSNVTPAKVEEAITVGSYDINGNFSSFSNWGPKVDILAPGEGIISLGSAASGASGPVTMTGTSMSAAHVTGAAALYLAQNPSATPAQVEQALIDAAQEFVTGTNGSTTNKSVWVGQGTPGTADVVVTTPPPPPPPPPSNTPPTAGFSYTATDLAVSFTDQSSDSDGSVVDWSWDFGDGGSSASQHPAHSYAAGGTYTVALTVTDDDGATNSTTQNVTVTTPPPPPPPPPSGGYAALDTFASIAYDGNDGSMNWLGPWQEIGEDGNPTDNEIRVVSESKCPDAICLRIKTKKKSRGILRAVDLSGAGTATLSFDYRRNNTKKANLALEISSDGGSTWTTLKTYAKGKDSSPQHDSFDITPYVSANTQIRFYVTFKGDRYFYVDNVEINGDGSSAGKMRTKY